jgi:UDP-glucuronate 4-epimerase
VDDLVEGIVRLIAVVPETARPAGAGDSISPVAPWRTVNIGGGTPVSLPDFIQAIEDAVGKRAVKVMKPMQPGDVVQTFASADLLETLTGYRPATTLLQGVPAFVNWYRDWVSG